MKLTILTSEEMSEIEDAFYAMSQLITATADDSLRSSQLKTMVRLALKLGFDYANGYADAKLDEKNTFIKEKEMAELQDIVDLLTTDFWSTVNDKIQKVSGGEYYIKLLRIAEILGLETPNELTTPRRNNGVSKDKEID